MAAPTIYAWVITHLVSHQKPSPTLQSKLDALSLKAHKLFLQPGRHLVIELAVIG